MEKFNGLYDIYNAVKALLTAGVPNLEDVNWYIGQYAGEQINIPDDIGAFVEFPKDIEFEPVSKSLSEADLRVRVYVHHKVVTEVDGHVPDADLLAHNTDAMLIKEALRWKVLTKTITEPGDDPEEVISTTYELTKRLHFVGFRSWHTVKGFLVSHIEFSTDVCH
jgi:hypothetical protein